MSNQTKNNNELQKGLMKMLDGLAEMRDDIEAKQEQRIWRDIQVPTTLYDALSRLTKDELTDIRKKLDIKKASSLKKEELIQLLQQIIPTMFKKECLKIDSERYSIVEKIAHQGGSVNAEHLSRNILNNLGSHGVVYTGSYNGEKVAVMPDEVMKAFQPINHTNVKEITSRNTEWIKLTQGLLYYYGALSTSKLIKMIKKYSSYEVDTVEFLTVIHDAENCYGVMKAAWNGFAHRSVFDSKRVLDEHQSRQDIPFYPFSKAQLITAGVPDYMEKNKSFKQFVKFLTRHYDLSLEEAEGHVDEYAHGIKLGQSPQDILQMLQHQFEMKGQNDVIAFMEHLMNLSGNTRQWFLKGYTAEEIHQLEKRNLKPSPDDTVKDNVIDFQTSKKVGRNDPCPCGSGKKYKKCCGR